MKSVKQVLILLVAFMAITVLGCKSSAQTAPNTAVTIQSVEEDPSDDVVIDWLGRNLGAQRPEWAIWAAMGDPDNQLSKLPRLEGKKAIPLSQDGMNLPVLEAWVNTQAYTQCGQRIRTAVTTEAGNAIEGDLQSTEATNVANQFASLYSDATITGLNKEMDTWVKTRSKSKGTEKYSYYVLYSISNDDLKASVDLTFNKIEAKDQKQQEAKVKLQDQMNRLVERVQF
jgi:hypothetical protein